MSADFAHKIIHTCPHDHPAALDPRVHRRTRGVREPVNEVREARAPRVHCRAPAREQSPGPLQRLGMSSLPQQRRRAPFGQPRAAVRPRRPDQLPASARRRTWYAPPTAAPRYLPTAVRRWPEARPEKPVWSGRATLMIRSSEGAAATARLAPASAADPKSSRNSMRIPRQQMGAVRTAPIPGCYSALTSGAKLVVALIRVVDRLSASAVTQTVQLGSKQFPPGGGERTVPRLPVRAEPAAGRQ